jgi:glycosyltransferase involved in cell wall biosynthesis
MTMNDGISIVIPVFNCEKYIASTLDSVLLNTKKIVHEVIVVNDGSTDSTKQILENYKEHVRVIEQENQGEASAINRGISESVMKYALALSSDDPCPDSELFSIAIDVLETQQEIVCVYPDWTILDQDGNIVSEVITREFSRKTLIEEFLCIPGPGSVFRVSSFKTVGGRNPQIKFISDYEFWVRLSTIGSFKRIPKTLGYWRSHSGSTSIRERSAAMARERVAVMHEFFLNSDKDIEISQNRTMANVYFSSALLCSNASRIPARRFLIRSIILNPIGLRERNILYVLYICLLPMSKVFFRMYLKLREKVTRTSV